MTSAAFVDDGQRERVLAREGMSPERLDAILAQQVPDAEKLSYAGQASHAGYPAEALAVLDQGMAKNAFTGADAAEAKKLRETVSRGAQSDRARATARSLPARDTCRPRATPSRTPYDP